MRFAIPALVQSSLINELMLEKIRMTICRVLLSVAQQPQIVSKRKGADFERQKVAVLKTAIFFGRKKHNFVRT